MNSKLTRYLKGNQALLLAACVLGVILTAWWAWAAGPLVSAPSLGRAPSVNTINGLNAGPYGQAATVAPSSGDSGITSSGSGQAAGSSVSSSGANVSSPILPPTNTQPSVPNCLPVEGANSDLIYYPCGGCGYSGHIASYPCCETGAHYVCGCGGTKADIMCPL